MSPSEASPGSAEQASTAGSEAAKKRSSASGGAQPAVTSGAAPGGQTQPVKAPAKSGSGGRPGSARRGRNGADPAQARPDDDTRPHAVVKDPGTERDSGRVPLAKPGAAEATRPGQPSPWSRDSATTRTTTMEPVNGYAGGPGGNGPGGNGPGGNGPGGNAPGYAPAGAVPPGYAAAPGGAGTATATPGQSARQMARRARLKVSHLGPWSVFKVSLTFSLCMFIVLLVAVAALWAVLDSAGVFKSIVDAANTLTNDNKETSIAEWLTFNRVMVIAVVLGAANVIAFTLLSTIGSLLYNLCSDFVGGIEVTLVER